MEVEAMVGDVIIVPRFHQIPYSRSLKAVSAKVVSRLRLAEAQGAAGIMGPTPDGKHIRGEELSLKDQPAKQLAFGLRVG
jgi:hypothetical protein